MLQVTGVSRAFGGVYANKNVTLHVAPGEVRGIIGPNGAGKSTLFSIISGQQRPDSGEVWLGDRRIDRLPPHTRAQLGIATVFQRSHFIQGLSLLENVMIGAHVKGRVGALGAAFRMPWQRREEAALKARAQDAVARMGLSDWLHRDPTALPLGQQRRAQVARALAGDPTVLLLDEPASGLRAEERDDLIDVVGDLRSAGVMVLLIEHDVALVSRLSDRVTVLDLGEVVTEGTPAEVMAHPRVIEAYLGVEATSHA